MRDSNGITTAARYHDFSAGHKVTGHENKCAHLHGHNYRVHFTIQSEAGVDGILRDQGTVVRMVGVALGSPLLDIRRRSEIGCAGEPLPE